MQWELLPRDVNDYSPRTGHTVIAYKDCIYVFGGIDEQDRQNDMYKYHKGWTKLKLQGEIPSARSGSLGCVYEEQFYFFGGYTWKHGEYFNDLFRFNPSNNQWEKITPKTQPPPARVDHSFTIQKNLCYVFGGSNGQKRFNDLHELNLCTLEWKALSQVRQLSARLGHIVKKINFIFFKEIQLKKRIDFLKRAKLKLIKLILLLINHLNLLNQPQHQILDLGYKTYLNAEIK